MSKEILLLVDALSREKNVSKEIVFSSLELALASAVKKKHKLDISAKVVINRDSGDFKSFRT